MWFVVKTLWELYTGFLFLMTGLGVVWLVAADSEALLNWAAAGLGYWVVVTLVVLPVLWTVFQIREFVPMRPRHRRLVRALREIDVVE
jgi:hypothetical protein